MRKFRLLKADEIEVKIKQVTEKGAVALIYKTSRVDMDILDETVGAENWQSEYSEIKGNLYCGIGIRDDVSGWVWKSDCGIESRSDGEGNEKKGEASDAFKRAGVQWGIGRELYTAPFIFLSLPTVANQNGKGYKLKNPFLKFEVSEIGYDEAGRITKLSIIDEKRAEVYKYPRKEQNAPQSAKQAAKPKAEKFEPLTKTELVQKWGVTNAEATIQWFEKQFKIPFKDWDEEVTECARAKLSEKKEQREAKQKAAEENADIPFPMTD